MLGCHPGTYFVTIIQSNSLNIWSSFNFCSFLQPFLCAVYMPKCTRSKDREYVYLPSLEMCRVASEKCRVLFDTDFLPDNLKCNNRIFPCKNCNNDVREMKFNAIGQCMSPLVPTDSSINHYPGKLFSNAIRFCRST